MTLKTQMTSDLAVFYNDSEFAETVSYTPIGGEATNITAIVTRHGVHMEPYVRGEITAIAIIDVQKSEVSTPQHGDMFTFDSQSWEIDPSDGGGVLYEDDEEYQIALRRVD